jgi:hypothetical protein
MQNNQDKVTADQLPAASERELERRELVRKLGKFALYAAPFTVLAHTNRAEAASGTGPRKTPFPRP